MPEQFAVVFTTGNKVIRRLIVPADGELLEDHSGPDETQHNMPWINDNSVAVAKAVVLAQLGFELSDGRCAVVDATGGLVLAIVHADPSLDALPGQLLILSETALVGDTYTNGAFYRRYAVVNTASKRVMSLRLLLVGSTPPNDLQVYVPAGNLGLGDLVAIGDTVPKGRP